MAASDVAAQAPGTVAYDIQITEDRGGFSGVLDPDDFFGSAAASIGDLDGNGVSDIVVGAVGDDDGGSSTGALWVLFLDTDFSVKSFQKISATAGGFGDPPGTFGLGDAVASLGDLDGDGVVDLAAGVPSATAGGVSNTGAVWILFLNPDGTVKSKQQIGSATGGFVGTLTTAGHFGAAVARVGDLDGDGVTELAVGVDNDNDGGFQYGSLWILFLHPDGTVKAQQKISKTQGGFGGDVDSSDHFGCSLAALDDLDGDGVPELAAGAYFGSGCGVPASGVVWVLFLAANGTVESQTKICALPEPGQNDQLFGLGVCTVGDLDGDGRRELAVGAPRYDGSSGSVAILFLDESGAVTNSQRISDFEGGFGGSLVPLAQFGWSLANPGDLDGDGADDLVVGAPGASTFSLQGDAWLLFLVRGPWTWLGHALGGGSVTPSLIGTGTLLPGQPATLALTKAPASSAATMVIGFTALLAPFKGGVLVPQPTLLVPLVTGASGELSLTTTWPASLPPGLTIYLQDWIVDATAPQGLAASNAASATTP